VFVYVNGLIQPTTVFTQVGTLVTLNFLPILNDEVTVVYDVPIVSALAGSFCTPDDVCQQFPVFKRNQPNSVQDAAVQNWLDDATAYIYSLFLARNINLTAFTLTTMQLIILRKLARESGTRDLAAVLRYTTAKIDMGAFGASQNDPRSPLTASRFRDGRFDEITCGMYDALFSPATARHISITPGIKGSVAGGDQPADQTAQSSGMSNAFSKQQVY
jgi:hypothetical protein